MEVSIINNVEELYHVGANAVGGLFIYGAKTIAMRTCKYLQSQGIEPKAFLVSNRFDNPTTLLTKDVLRVEEECDRTFPSIIIAVSGEYIWDAKETLDAYATNIRSIGIISPCMLDDLPDQLLLSDHSYISDRAFLAENVRLEVDETSTLIIEDGAVIEKGVVVTANNGSKVHIGEECVIGRETEIIADGGDIMIGGKTAIGEYVIVAARSGGKCTIGEQVLIASRACIDAVKDGVMKIGSRTTINRDANISVMQSNIDIGEDNMLSFYVKISVGHHHIQVRDTVREITNRTPIKTGHHVWIGAGATLLPGCDVGDGSVVGVATMVNKKIPVNCSCGGNPARIIKENIRWER
jgi:acetyltransferase-like isoleucine patch superfamily enzyme